MENVLQNLIVNKSKLVIVLHYYFEGNYCRNNYSFIQSFHKIFSLIHLNHYYVNDFFIKMSVIYCVRFQIVCGEIKVGGAGKSC